MAILLVVVSLFLSGLQPRFLLFGVLIAWCCFSLGFAWCESSVWSFRPVVCEGNAGG